MLYADSSEVALLGLWKNPSRERKSPTTIQGKVHNSSFTGDQEDVFYEFRCSDPHNKKIIILKNPSFTHTSPKEKLLPKGTDLGGLVSQIAMSYDLHKLRED